VCVWCGECETEGDRYIERERAREGTRERGREKFTETVSRGPLVLRLLIFTRSV